MEGKENALTRPWQMTDCGEWSFSYGRLFGDVEQLQFESNWRGCDYPNPGESSRSRFLAHHGGQESGYGGNGGCAHPLCDRHMLGNLKIYSGPNEINAYSRFLREVGMPELAYGQLLWVVRITLLACVGFTSPRLSSLAG